MVNLINKGPEVIYFRTFQTVDKRKFVNSLLILIKMAMTRQSYKKDCIILSTLEKLVPKDHLVRKIDSWIDFTFIKSW